MFSLTIYTNKYVQYICKYDTTNLLVYTETCSIIPKNGTQTNKYDYDLWCKFCQNGLEDRIIGYEV